MKNTKGKHNKQTTKQYKLIVSETEWLLWKARNERVIGEKQIKPPQLKSRQVAEMDDKSQENKIPQRKMDRKWDYYRVRK